MNRHFNIEEIRGFRRRKDPTLTFIGGLIIGGFVGLILGFTFGAHYVLGTLNLI